MAYGDGPGVQHKQTPMRQHKQGRFVQEISGHLMRPSGDGIDLHEMLTGHKPSIDLYPVHDNAMRVSGIFRGSYTVVDRASSPAVGKIVVVRYNGQVVIRRLIKKDGRFCLIADDPREPILYCDIGAEIERLGVLTYSIIDLNKLP